MSTWRLKAYNLAKAYLAQKSPARTSPGMMALQLIPFLAYSRAATLTKYSMPAFPCRKALLTQIA